ncbi:putative GCN5-related N-acetyltransferase [metagenome]|uniref:Putative GCN5-related N-acetyltransferase n=1 Tax=metagenome TaxID=256318 RepID=A0A2P2C759_9ZZZZ
MTTIEIRRVDPLDEALLRAWWETGHTAFAERPYDVDEPWSVSRVSLRQPNPDLVQVLLGAFDPGGAMVGSASAKMPQRENPHLVYGTVSVPPDHRRRGIGSRLLAAVEDIGRQEGRSVLLVEAAAPLTQESPGTLFGAARGFAVGNLEEVKVLDLVASEPAWDACEQEAHAARGDYRLVTWGTSTPAEHVQGFCDLLGVFFSNVPLGEVPLEDMVWTPERLRAYEDRLCETGFEEFTAAVVAPDGSLVGVSDVGLLPQEPEKAEVGITLVLPEHRGHRLGMAMKLATHRALRAAYPQCRIVVTANAGANAHMNAVNERLGYRVVERLPELKKDL